MTRIAALLATTATRGSVLLASGGAGPGRTSLLGAAAAMARDAGMNVVACAGAQFEARSVKDSIPTRRDPSRNRP